MDEFVNEYLDENPQDELIFEEIMDRANLSKEERYVFWNAVARFAKAIFVQNLNGIVKDLPSHAHISQEIDTYISENF